MDATKEGQGSRDKGQESPALLPAAPDPNPSPRKRVLVLASTFPRWANDTEPPFVYNLSRSLADSFEVTVLAPHAPGAFASEQMGGVSVHRFRYFWPAGLQKLAYGGILPNLKRNRWLWAQVPFFLAAQLIAALRLIHEERPDVIHAHWLLPQGLVAAMLNRLTGVPILVTAHGSDVYAVRGRLQRALKRWVLTRTRYVTAVSFNLLREICSLGLTPEIGSDVISMGVDTKQFNPSMARQDLLGGLHAERPLLLFVGRLYEQKGVQYLLRAMPAVLERFPSATLVIIGKGPLKDQLVQTTKDLGIAENVQFLGALAPEELPGYYASADVFVAPSIVGESGDREAFGLVYAEAMASGCPVIGSDVGGTRELIIDDKTGVLVPQKDSVALSTAICKVLEDSELRQRIKTNALSWVRNRFDEKAVAQRYREALRKAAA